MTAEPMPADRLAEIKARRAELTEHATIGDWRYDDCDTVLVFPAGGGMAEAVASITVWGKEGSAEETAIGEFIGHAPTDTDALVAEVERLNGVVQFLGSHLQRDSLDIVDELRRQAAQEPLLPIEDVERFLKRERDKHEARTGPWHDADDVLDAFRLHMVTGTPLTSPRPTGGPEAPGVGPEPLTEAEELRAERDRLRHALERAALSVEHDSASSACRELPAAHQRYTEHAEACPACDVAAALNPEQVQL